MDYARNNMKRNILIIAPYFPPEGGGLENYAFQVAKKLKNTYTVFFISATRNKKGTRVVDGITLTQIEPSFFVSNTPIKFGFSRYLKKFIQKNQIDLVHGHMPVPFLSDVAARVCKQIGVPFFLTFHATDLRKGSWTDVVELFYRPILKQTFKLSTRVFGVTKKSQEGVMSTVKDLTVIPPGVEFVQSEVKMNRDRSFVFAAQLSKTHELKGLSILIDAVEMMSERDFTVYVAGDGDMREEYERRITEKGLSEVFVFLGWVDREQIFTYTRNARAQVVPSVSNAEGFPTVMPEALSQGTALIGSRVGGIPEMIQDGQNGFLVEPANPKDLSEKLEYALNHPEKMIEMGEFGRREVEKDFTWESIAQKYADKFEKHV